MSLTWSLQALLVRHETYVADAEQQLHDLRCQIDGLDADRSDLQLQNVTLLDENKSLRDKLHSANGTVSESEAHITSLTATLESAQLELHKLDTLVARTETLEKDLIKHERERERTRTTLVLRTQTLEKEVEQHERERSQMQAALALRTEQEHIANKRWQTAEGNLAALERRLEVIEADAINNRQQQHKRDSVAGLVDRQDSSSFLKDILQDNATLQNNLLEVQELLRSSNTEVDKLRQRLFSHQLLDDLKPTASARNSTADLRTNPEVHVHHHYHGPTAVADRRHSVQPFRTRSKRKRQAISFGQFPIRSQLHTPQESVASFDLPTPISANTSLVHFPKLSSDVSYERPRRDSHHLPSIPSSPISSSMVSVFDRVAATDSSRPTTPGIGPADSPPPAKRTSRQPQRISASFFKSLEGLQDRQSELSSSPPMKHLNEISIPRIRASHADEELRSEVSEDDSHVVIEHSLVDFEKAVAPRPIEQTQRSDRGKGLALHIPIRPLRGATSLETLPFQPISKSAVPTDARQPSRATSTQPVLNATMVHAYRPTAVKAYSHDVLAGVVEQRSTSGSSAPSGPGIGKKVGGWMFSRWGVSPSATSDTSSTNTSLESAKSRGPRSEQPPSSNANKKTSAEARKDTKRAASAPMTATAKTLSADSTLPNCAEGDNSFTPAATNPTTSPGAEPSDSRNDTKTSKALKRNAMIMKPTRSTSNDSSTTLTTTTTTTMMMRAPGVNQKGVIPALAMPSRAPILNALDETALLESLNE